MPDFRIPAADVVFQVPAAEPRMTSRDWRRLDRYVAKEIADIDACLGCAAGRGKNWPQIDLLLDERLLHRPADVMDSGRSS
jgi:hypothetical protein